MAVPLIKPAFTIGEIAPSMYGRADLARFHVGCSTMRNLFVSYRGGAYSRAGTLFVGFSKQTGRNFPPRLIRFQFNINQGLALEFGNFYMRVISDGAFVTETAIPITAITNADPAVVTASGSGANVATPNDGAVVTSYAPGDDVTLAGGTFSVPAILSVTNTKLLSLQVDSPGTGVYAPADTIHIAGGTQSTPAILTVSHTQVSSATIAAPGTGGTPGPAVVTGTTGTGTKFQANVTISAGGVITSVNSIALGGDYSVNPTTPTNEPVTGGGLAGAALNIKIGVLTFTISNAGVFTANAAGGNFTQASTSGTGTAATFRFALFGPNVMGIAQGGVYTVFPGNPVAQAATTGSGSGVTFTVTSGSAAPFVTGDWVFIQGVGGMTEVNGETFVVGAATIDTFELFDVYGNPIDSTAFGAFTGGGTIARIFTLDTPYAEQDLPYLKFTQSADTMTICDVNQKTLTEYQARDLIRTNDTDWTFSSIVAEPSAAPPNLLTGITSSPGTTNYQYCVTSVADDGTESVRSPLVAVYQAVNVAGTAGTNTLGWDAVQNITEYNIYKASPTQAPALPPPGTQFGFAGSAFGVQFTDSNIVPDFVQVPPLHKDPFARGQILTAAPVAGGGGYTAITFTINTITGSGAILTPVIVGTSLAAIIVEDHGKNYAPTDTVTVIGDGGGATATLNIGPQTGTYPSVVEYFQERRTFGNTLNNPDTYFMSQPGAFRNFDSRIPTIDSDAIIGSPWAVQVDGIQFMVSMPGGLVVLTGLSAWQLTGTGGSSLNPQPITPSTEQAQPQAYNGCSATVPPIKIDYDIVYVQAKGSIYRDLSYQFYTNIYTGTDLTLNSSHLFTGFTMKEHAWCEEPYKLLWAVRDDGVLLNLCYLKPQEIAGWSRHDTQGTFESLCSVTEPPVDALYLATQRPIGTHTPYMIERMDNRLWSGVEDAWCVDCALALPQPTPDAALRASSANGLGAVTGAASLIGGANYSAATTATVVDDNGKGPGTGALPALTIVAGVITAVTFAPADQGVNYIRPKLVIVDPTNAGSGADAVLILDTTATFTADAPVFVPADVGSVIRMGGGIATVTAFIDVENVTAQITSPIVQIIPNTTLVRPAASGSWTLTAPTSTFGGLTHLAGATVTGLADGNVVAPTIVPPNGVIDLGTSATSGVIGLAFKPQLQSMYLDAGEPTVQGQRKKVGEVTLRIETSRGLKVGTNQPDGSTQSPPQIAPEWNNLTDVPDDGPNFPPKPYNAVATPLRTGDIRVPTSGGFQTPGQICVQQDFPLPMNVLALISEDLAGDTPSMKFEQRRGGGQQQNG